MIRRGLSRTVRNKRALRRTNSPDNFKKLRKGVAFNVEFHIRPHREQHRKFVHVGWADVSLIWTRMHRDSMGAGFHASDGSMSHTGDAEIPRIPKQGNLVEVHTQPRHE